MRYAVQGEYCGQELFQDPDSAGKCRPVAVGLCLESTAPPILLLAFLAMYCIYEIGYSDDDGVGKERGETDAFEDGRALRGVSDSQLVWMAVFQHPCDWGRERVHGIRGRKLPGPGAVINGAVVAADGGGIAGGVQPL